MEHRWGLKPNHKAILIWHLFALAYYFTTSCAVGEDKLVDLSHTFDNDTIYWVTEPKLNLTITYKGIYPGKDYWYQKDVISAATHGGTHIDAPCHFAEGRWCVSDIPLENLVVPAAVVDISHHVGDNPNIHLVVEHLMEWERNYGQIPDKSLLLVHTGWSRFWPDPVRYSGSAERNASLLKFPSITSEVAEWLVANRKIIGIGIDVMSIDVPHSSLGTHVTLMKENIYGLENVNNPGRLPPTGALVSVMPMKLKSASGAPCRIVAHIPSTTGGADCSKFSNLMYIISLIISIIILDL